VRVAVFSIGAVNKLCLIAILEFPLRFGHMLAAPLVYTKSSLCRIAPLVGVRGLPGPKIRTWGTQLYWYELGYPPDGRASALIHLQCKEMHSKSRVELLPDL